MGEGASGQRHAGTRALHSLAMNEALIEFIMCLRLFPGCCLEPFPPPPSPPLTQRHSPCQRRRG